MDKGDNISTVRKLMTAYHQSATGIRRYYEQPSFMGLLNVGRKELPHSCIISWLFDSASFNQDTPDSPLMHLLDIAVKRADQQDKIGEDRPISTCLSNSIYGRAFSIERSVCTREEVIIDKEGNRRRSDISIRCNINYRNEGTKQKLNICIENKVLSSEHTSQTSAYSNYYLDDGDDWLFLFLTPLSSVKLDNYEQLEKGNRCESDMFIQINYQDLLDYVLEPLINSVDKRSQVYFIIDDYIKTLRYPIMEEKSNKKTIMAMGQEETKLLNDFWEGNHELIELALMAMSNNNNLDPEVQESAKNAYDTIQSLQSARKDSTRFAIVYPNDDRDDDNGKGYTKVDVAIQFASKFCEKNPTYIIDEDTANKAITSEINTTTKKIFNSKITTTEEIKLSNGNYVFFNKNIWGVGRDCWLKLSDYLSRDNPYFRIEPIK